MFIHFLQTKLKAKKKLIIDLLKLCPISRPTFCLPFNETIVNNYNLQLFHHKTTQTINNSNNALRIATAIARKQIKI